MHRYLGIGVALACLSLCPQAFSQSSNAALSGTVSDAAKALIPGVSITATNTATGIVSTAITNESGTYNIPSLLPGVYTVTAELTGFQTRTYTDVRLGNAAQVRLNFALEVAGLNTTVEVTVSADRLLLESSSSVGGVLPEKTVQELPVIGTVGNNVLDLVKTLPGLNLANDLINGANDSKLAGVSAANVQVRRDGIDASQSVRWPTGISSATIMNPDLIGEVRMILAPVDAEVGRGNSQVQIQTKSGTNVFHGSAVWNIQNSALDPNTWSNNRVQPKPATRPWANMNEGTASLGGPIVKNKTFFFALWNGLLPVTRSLTNPTVLTPCARQGIFRYYDNWTNGNALQVTTAGSTPTIAVVDQLGNPKAPATNPNGTSHNGILRYASVFGPLVNTPSRPDCSDAVVQGAPWDRYRTRMDPTGYVTKVLGVMPAVNNYEVGDGLNIAGSRWLRSQRGSGNRYAIGWPNIRNQFNLKVDHNFNARHKLSVGWSLERSHDERVGAWPTYFAGRDFSQPQVLTVNVTSTLSPTLLNEARFGTSRTGTNTPGPFANPKTGKDALAFFPNIQGIPFLPQLGTLPNGPICVCGGQPFPGETSGGFVSNLSESTPVYSYADTLSWTRGTHAFKGGLETRFVRSRYAADVDNNDWSSYARGMGGESPLAPIEGINATNMPGLQGTATTGNNAAMRSLLSLLTGSLARVTELYWLGSAERLDKFDDYRISAQRTRELRHQTVSAFFKDDWKVHRDLTLNLGLRWDYYGVPWVSDGLTASLSGGSPALFGYSGRSFADWMRPGQRGDLTQLVFVGPDSPNPELRAWKKDWNNLGPAVGFAWQVPWFGAGQTTVRGGYQVSFLRDRGFDTGGGGGLSSSLANAPGSAYQATITGGPGDLEYLDLTKISRIVPVPVPIKPMLPIPVTARDTSLVGVDSNSVTPYVHNLTLAVTRNVGRNVTLDARYIGTLSRKLYGTIEINAPNFLYNGLREAFDAARAGGESALLDQIFRGINIAGAGFGPVGAVFNGVMQTGALHLRSATASQLQNNLANGNYVALANSLNLLNYSKAGGMNSGLPDIPVGVNGAVLRFNGLPENLIKTNPQFNNVTLQTNSGNTNYHSLQTQVTLRPVVGVSLQASYTWSKLLGSNPGSPNSSSQYTNPVDRHADYTLQPGDRRHDFRTNGTFRLPLGPGQLLLRNSGGILARIAEEWQMSWILDVGTGAPANITAQNMLYANGVPDTAAKFDPKTGKVQWKDGAVAGNYFGYAYTKVRDPQCAEIAANLQPLCTLSAVADSSGNIVLRNPRPGTRGNLGLNVLELPGLFSLDGSLSKAVRITETKRLRFRLDAANIMNHPQPDNPDLNINSGVPFGNIGNKTGNRATVGPDNINRQVRQFQLQVRLEF